MGYLYIFSLINQHYLSSDGAAYAGQRVVSLDSHQQFVGGQLDTDVVRVIVTATQVHHHLHDLVAVVYTYTQNGSVLRGSAAADGPARHVASCPSRCHGEK